MYLYIFIDILKDLGYGCFQFCFIRVFPVSVIFRAFFPLSKRPGLFPKIEKKALSSLERDESSSALDR